MLAPANRNQEFSMSLSIRAAFLAGAMLVASAPALAETLTLDQAIARAEAATPALRAAAR